MHSDFRWEQRFQNFQSSLVEFRDAVEQKEYTNLERAGLIQLFEMCFELSWKTLKDLLFYEGYDVKTPRAVIKQAFANGIITEGEIWLEALEGRNLFSYTYNNKMAQGAVSLIKETYAPILFALEIELQTYKP